MALTTTIKRAPKWAWYASGGVALGVVAIEVYKRRAVDTPSETDATNGAQVIGSPSGTTTAPSPVITPPVIFQPDTPDFTGLFSVFGDSLNNAVVTLGQLAQGDQGLASTAIGMTGQIATGAQDIAREAIASAGQAPAPAATVPTPIIVTVPTPSTPAITPAPAPAPAPAPCPAAFPHRSSRGCYKCTKDSGPHNNLYTHRYQNGYVSGGNSQC